jgi:hypothetical protein
MRRSILLAIFIFCKMDCFSQIEDSIIEDEFSAWILSAGFTSSELFGSQIDIQLNNSNNGSVDRENGAFISLNYMGNISKFVFLKTGLDFIEKESALQSDVYVYPAAANVSFLNIPIGLGLKTPASKELPSFSLEGGINIQITLKSQDNLKAGLRSSFFTTAYHNPNSSFFISPKLWIPIDKKTRLIIGYMLQRDISPYFSYYDSVKNDTYDVKFMSNVFMIGFAFL